MLSFIWNAGAHSTVSLESFFEQESEVWKPAFSITYSSYNKGKHSSKAGIINKARPSNAIFTGGEALEEIFFLQIKARGYI